MFLTYMLLHPEDGVLLSTIQIWSSLSDTIRCYGGLVSSTIFLIFVISKCLETTHIVKISKACLFNKYSGVQTDGVLSGRLQVLRIKINDDGKLEIEFKTQAKFRGQFVVTHRTLAGQVIDENFVSYVLHTHTCKT